MTSFIVLPSEFQTSDKAACLLLLDCFDRFWDVCASAVSCDTLGMRRKTEVIKNI
jgi:hypothetical protein